MTNEGPADETGAGSDAGLIKRTQRIYIMIVLTITLMLALFNYLLIQDNLQKQLANIQQSALQLRLTIEQVTLMSQEHILRMQALAEDGFAQPALLDLKKFDELHSLYKGELAGALLDKLPVQSRINIGNVFANPDELDSVSELEKNIAIRLFDLAAATHKTSTTFRWSYYYSAQKRFSSIYPYLSGDEVLWATGAPTMRDAIEVIFDAGGTRPVELVGPRQNPERNVLWSEVYADAAGQGLMVTLLAPVYHPSNYVGVVGADITLESLGNSLRESLNAKFKSTIIEQKGTVLASTNPAYAIGKIEPNLETLLIVYKEKGQTAQFFEFGASYWLVYPLKHSPWNLVIEVDNSLLFSQSLQGTYGFSILSLVIVLLLTFSGLALNWLVSPIRELTVAAQRLSRGDFSQQIDVQRRDEVGILASAFNEMTANLQGRLAEIQFLNQALEQRVMERTAQLEATNRELESFSYSVSHDLRAPLRAISGYAAMIQDEHGDSLPPTVLALLARIGENAAKMGRLIDDLLQLSKITRVNIQREEVNLSAIANSIAAELAESESKRVVNFTIAPDLVAGGDAGLLRIVLDNLLRNAWKFTGKHAAANIEFGETIINNERVFFVRDDGAGFDPAFSKKLFGAFQRLHREDEFAGTGIGLATVHRIILRHSGRVWAESAIEQGATIYFTLPETKG